jgi:hypothetical protein
MRCMTVAASLGLAVTALVTGGCASLHRAAPASAAAAVPATSDVATVAAMAVPPPGPSEAAHAAPASPAAAAPAAAAPAAAVAPVAAPVPAQVAKAGSGVAAAPPRPAAPASAARPTPAAPAPRAAEPVPAAAAAAPKPAAQTLDLAALEQRLRETRCIGLFTKLSLKNQVDDLLAQFRAYYRAQGKPPPTPLRQHYDGLLLKVITLLQDGDPPLASAIMSSREAIWGILADPDKLSKI